MTALWRDDVITALIVLGGKARLRKIYEQTETIRREAGRSCPPSIDGIVSNTLECHSSDSDNYRAGRPDLFCMPEGKGAGIWALRPGGRYSDVYDGE